MAKKPKADLLKTAEEVGRESGLSDRLAKYREQRRAYEQTLHTKTRRAPSLPVQRATGHGPAGRRVPKGFAGDGLFP